jgi:transcriptional regulator with XRE-family HTH domain
MITSIATRLKELRLNKRLRQDQVADLIGVTKSTMSAYENGMRQPSYDVLVSLARLYHVSADYLLGLSNARVIDLSELTEEEINAVVELVRLLSNK